MVILEAHLLNLGLASGQLLFTKDNGKGDSTLFRSLELLWEFRLQLVRKLRLVEKLAYRYFRWSYYSYPNSSTP